jgi:hypothetical protein
MVQGSGVQGFTVQGRGVGVQDLGGVEVQAVYLSHRCVLVIGWHTRGCVLVYEKSPENS